MKYELGFIGCGNMGGALITCATKTTDVKKIAVCDHNETKVKKYENAYGVVGTTTEEVAKHARFVVWGVKPQMMKAALAPIAAILRERTDVVVITMAAGLSISAIRGYIKKELPIIRIMPNTPVQVGKGLIMYDFNELVDEKTVNEFVKDMAFAGIMDKIDETLIDAGTAVSGCGPAYMFMYIDALAKGGVKCGLTEEQAILYAAATMEGAAKLLLESKLPPEILKQNVCSPGGSTIKGVEALEQNGLYSACEDAVIKAYKRNVELGK